MLDFSDGTYRSSGSRRKVGKMRKVWWCKAASTIPGAPLIVRLVTLLILSLSYSSSREEERRCPVVQNMQAWTLNRQTERQTYLEKKLATTPELPTAHHIAMPLETRKNKKISQTQ